MVLNDARLLAVAARHNKSPAQVCIRFQIQRGVVVIPKSASPERIRLNASVFDFVLSDADMAALDSMDAGFRYCVPKVDIHGESVARDTAHPHYPFNIPY